MAGSSRDPGISFFLPCAQGVKNGTQEKDGRGQSGPKSCFPINVDKIWGDEEFSR